MNDNTDPNPTPKTTLNINLGIGMEINCHQDDPRLDIFKSQQFIALLEGPISSAIFSMINQFLVFFHPELILTLNPPEKPTQKELN
jgi:hypothetical protein